MNGNQYLHTLDRDVNSLFPIIIFHSRFTNWQWWTQSSSLDILCYS